MNVENTVFILASPKLYAIAHEYGAYTPILYAIKTQMSIVES